MKSIKPKDITKNWHLIDAKGKILGRVATEVASLLRGKNKTYFTPHLDTGDYVVVVNAKEIALSGKKEIQKTYYKHSGYPGGLKEKTASQIRAINPNLLIRHAVVGMLPKNRIGKAILKNLFIYESSQNPHSAKFSKN